MDATIITIGDEILNGTTVDTNSAWIAQQINSIGISVKEIISISDDKEHILKTLNYATENFFLVLITGGLGPTKDDLTKNTLCEFFQSSLMLNENVLKTIDERFQKRNIPLSQKIRDQALLPHNCTVIPNSVGTAAGMWFNHKNPDSKINGTVVISMPGVPYEMKEMMTAHIIPKIKKEFMPPQIIDKYVMTSGIGESMIAERIEDIENRLPNHIKLAYLPSPGMVKLRLTAKGENKRELEKEVNDFAEKIESRLDKYAYSLEGKLLEESVADLLKKLKSTFSSAESCTGGKIAHKITSVPGSSNHFEGAIVCYSKNLKMALLDVKIETLKEHGAVSVETVSEMLDGSLKYLNAPFSVAVSGVAGPESDEGKPVGLIYIGVADKHEKRIKKYQFGTNREINIEYACNFALHELRLFLLDRLAKAA